MQHTQPSIANTVAERLEATGLFARVEITAAAVRAHARNVEVSAWYQVSWERPDDGSAERVQVGLYTPDRWLSESIEADLLHQGDKLDELLEDELIDQGFDGRLTVEHFRDDELRYVFRSAVAVGDDDDDARRIVQVVLAYQACFEQLGDMAAEDESAL